MIKNDLDVVQKYLTNDSTETCLPAFQLHSIQTKGTTAQISLPLEATALLETRSDGNKNRITSGFEISKKTSNGYLELQNLDQFSSVSTVGNKVSIHFEQLEPGTEYLVNMVHYANYQQFKFVTQCSCNVNGMDVTGRPIRLSVQQNEGYVMFEFIDNSQCDSAYAFSRESALEEFARNIGTATSFAPNFFVTSADTCDSAKISPGLSSADDLKLSRLEVGAIFAYCVRATNTQQYMDSPYDASEGSIALKASDNTCASHTIHWESSVSGLITTEPNAGSLAIEEVKVTWQLLSDEFEDLVCDGCSGETETTAGGSFEFQFNVVHPYLNGMNDAEVPVKLFFTKTTNGIQSIEHIFLCNEGQDICDPDEGFIFYLKHLHFKTPLHIYDDTSIPFSGRIIVYNTAFEGSTGCPISKANVCIQHLNALKILEDLICRESDANGYYEAPVIIGSIVHNIVIHSYNHKFERTFENKIEYSQGLKISAGGFYTQNDFMDMDKTKLSVEGMSLDHSNSIFYVSTPIYY